MRIVQKVSEARHFLVISVLALMMSVFAANAGKAAMQSKPGTFGDPVISSMNWEQPASNYTDDGPGDIPATFCNSNCPKNCNGNCDTGCNRNCDRNC